VKEPLLSSMIEMIRVPAGSFRSQPQGLVTITYSFSLSKFPVTNLLWHLVMDEPLEGEPFLPKTEINWKESIKFCGVLNERLGLIGAASERSSGIGNFGFRLPTEAEWVRGFGTSTLDDFPASELGDYAWLQNNSGGSPQPVGLKLPNALGLHDMLGNVWEWCWDWFEPSPTQTLDPTGPSLGSGRVLRGAAHQTKLPKDGALHWRSMGASFVRTSAVGFRLARTQPSEEPSFARTLEA